MSRFSDDGGVFVAQSMIDGVGVFAARAFEPGETVRRRREVREVTAATPLRDGEQEEHCERQGDRVVLIGFPDRHVNHGCEPTAYYRAGEDGATEVVAMRPLAHGDEITVDYAIHLADERVGFDCRCGAALCRGRVGSLFALPPERQRLALALLLPWFRAAHAERLAALDARLRLPGDGLN